MHLLEQLARGVCCTNFREATHAQNVLALYYNYQECVRVQTSGYKMFVLYTIIVYYSSYKLQKVPISLGRCILSNIDIPKGGWGRPSCTYNGGSAWASQGYTIDS